MVLPQTWKEILTEEEGSGGSLYGQGLGNAASKPFPGKPLARGICSLSQLSLLSQCASSVTYFPQTQMLTLWRVFPWEREGRLMCSLLASFPFIVHCFSWGWAASPMCTRYEVTYQHHFPHRTG